VRIFRQPWPDYIEGETEGDVEYALLKIRVGAGDRAVNVVLYAAHEPVPERRAARVVGPSPTGVPPSK